MDQQEKLLRESQKLICDAAALLYEGTDTMEQSGLVDPDLRESIAGIQRKMSEGIDKRYRSQKDTYQPK